MHNQNFEQKDLNSFKITNNIEFQNAGVIGHPSSVIFSQISHLKKTINS